MECKHTTILKQKRALIIIKLLKKLDVETVLEILKTITKKDSALAFFKTFYWCSYIQDFISTYFKFSGTCNFSSEMKL